MKLTRQRRRFQLFSVNSIGRSPQTFVARHVQKKVETHGGPTFRAPILGLPRPLDFQVDWPPALPQLFLLPSFLHSQLAFSAFVYSLYNHLKTLYSTAHPSSTFNRLFLESTRWSNYSLAKRTALRQRQYTTGGYTHVRSSPRLQQS